MTDNEIVKALKCCLNDSCYTSECFFFKETKDGEHCQTVAIKYALDLINRQKAEIERLLNTRVTNHSVEKQLKTAKAEAIKEFAERLKDNMNDIPRMEYGSRDLYYLIGKDFVDNLVKEMVGDTE